MEHEARYDTGPIAAHWLLALLLRRMRPSWR
jgi:hypothetical protein